jgi:hypothetical protein
MDKVLSYLHGMVADSADGSLSNKRVITLLCTILMIIGFIGNMFFGYQVDAHMFDSIMFVVIGGMGITGVEKFVPRPADPVKPDPVSTAPAAKAPAVKK